jgi:hypothetical protein
MHNFGGPYKASVLFLVQLQFHTAVSILFVPPQLIHFPLMEGLQWRQRTEVYPWHDRRSFFLCLLFKHGLWLILWPAYVRQNF